MIVGNLKYIIEEEGNEFSFMSYGLECYGIRNPSLLTWCGYIEIPRKHGAYSVIQKIGTDFDVHGGITYDDFNKTRIKIGFDCAHYMDVAPSLVYMGMMRNQDAVYRTKEFVETELRRVAKQIHALYPEHYDTMMSIMVGINK